MSISIILLLSILSISNFSSNTIQNSYSFNSNSQITSNIKSNKSEISPYSKIAITTSYIKQITGLQWLLDQGFNGSNVIIGSVDTGIANSSYPSEFGSKLLAEKSFVTTQNGYGGTDLTIKDTIGHGTETASVAAGYKYGMAPGAYLVASKIYNNSITGNAGYPGEETTSGVVNGIIFCAQQGAKIINLSFGQYSNIANDGRQYIVDKLSKEQNIIFTISAANEGESGIDGASIGTPGTAFQAITVAASQDANTMAPFSSSGIRVDYTVKPDVTAPGVNIPTILGLGSGTSFSAPIVAGGIAVILDGLTRSGKNYTVGAIKAALLETANPIGDYPVWYQGAGMVNFTAAYLLLMGKPLTNNVPTVVTAFPKNLPISPLNNLFNDQTVPFNLTVVSSQYDQAIISLHGIPSETMSFNSQQYFNASERLSLLFHPTSTTLPGTYSGYLLLTFNSGQVVNVTIQFSVKSPILKILFDETRNGFVNTKLAGKSSVNLADPWGDTTFLLGQYRYFYSILAMNDISVTPFFKGSYTNLTYLNQFDEIMFPYPNSKITNTFTDWYNNSLFNGTFTLTEPTLLFSQNEINTLNTYIQGQTKGILILTSDQQFTNTTAFNSFLNSFGLGFDLSNPSVTIDKEPFSISSTNSIFSNISSLDYYGTTFTSVNYNPNVQSLENGKFLLYNGYDQAKGRILVSGSAYFAENFMLNPYHDNYVNDCKFLLNILTWTNGNNPSNNIYAPNTYTTSLATTNTNSNSQTIFSCNQQTDTSSQISSSNTVHTTPILNNFFYDSLILLGAISITALVIILIIKKDIKR